MLLVLRIWYWINTKSTPKILSIILPYCLSNNSWVVSSENLVLDQLENPLIDIFVYSYHLSAWFCIDFVTRYSVLVTHGAQGLKQSLMLINLLFVGKATQTFWWTASSHIWKWPTRIERSDSRASFLSGV